MVDEPSSDAEQESDNESDVELEPVYRETTVEHMRIVIVKQQKLEEWKANGQIHTECMCQRSSENLAQGRHAESCSTEKVRERERQEQGQRLLC